MDFEDIPEAEESPVIVQGEEPYYYEENPLMSPTAESAEKETFYYEEKSNSSKQMPPAAPQQDVWMMPEPEADDALTYDIFLHDTALSLIMGDIASFMKPILKFLMITAPLFVGKCI